MINLCIADICVSPVICYDWAYARNSLILVTDVQEVPVVIVRWYLLSVAIVSVPEANTTVCSRIPHLSQLLSIRLPREY